MPTRRITPVLFIIASALFLAAAIRDLFFPTLFSHGHGRPAASASVGVVLLIVGLAARRRRTS